MLVFNTRGAAAQGESAAGLSQVLVGLLEEDHLLGEEIVRRDVALYVSLPAEPSAKRAEFVAEAGGVWYNDNDRRRTLVTMAA